jgi:hypothetical protein
MPRFVLCIEDQGERWFLPWSTIVDAPVAYGMSEEDYRRWFEGEYGRTALFSLDDHIRRAKESGCSMFGETLESALIGNRAGPDKSEATLSEIVAAFIHATREAPHD